MQRWQPLEYIMVGPSSASCVTPQRVRMYSPHRRVVGQVTVNKANESAVAGNPMTRGKGNEVRGGFSG